MIFGFWQEFFCSGLDCKRRKKEGTVTLCLCGDEILTTPIDVSAIIRKWLWCLWKGLIWRGVFSILPQTGNSPLNHFIDSLGSRSIFIVSTTRWRAVVFPWIALSNSVPFLLSRPSFFHSFSRSAFFRHNRFSQNHSSSVAWSEADGESACGLFRMDLGDPFQVE